MWFSWWYACWSSIKTSILISNSHVKSSSTCCTANLAELVSSRYKRLWFIEHVGKQWRKTPYFNHSLMGSSLHVHIYVHPNPLTSIYICKIFSNVIENFNKSFLIKFNYHKYTGIITTWKKVNHFGEHKIVNNYHWQIFGFYGTWNDTIYRWMKS